MVWGRVHNKRVEMKKGEAPEKTVAFGLATAF